MNEEVWSEKKDAEDVRFRCPHCQKLYCTQADVFEGSDPLFDCGNCQKSFLLTREVNEFGLFKSQDLTLNSFSKCARCHYLKPLGSDECPSCGVFSSKLPDPEKLLALQKSESPYLYELNQNWQKVLSDFANENEHQKFIRSCQQKMALNFAFTKYAEFKSTVGSDLTCDHYMKQVQIRLEEQFKATEASYYNSVTKNTLSRTQIIFLAAGLFGLALLIYNKFRPTFPNLTGLVVAITVLSFGLVFYSSEKIQVK